MRKQADFSSDLNSYEGDFLFFRSKIEELRKELPNKFVAIKDKEVISSGDSVAKVAESIRKQGIEPSGTVIEFVSKKEQVLIL